MSSPMHFFDHLDGPRRQPNSKWHIDHAVIVSIELQYTYHRKFNWGTQAESKRTVGKAEAQISLPKLRTILVRSLAEHTQQRAK